MRILYQLGSTWPHVGSKNLPKSRLRGVLGRLGRVLGRLGRILERLGGILGRLGRVLERLGRILECLGGILEASLCVLYASCGVSSAPRATWHHVRLDWVQGRRSAWPQRTNKYQREERLTAERLPTERLQTSVDHLPLNPDTQLGAFGPGADPTRSRAAIPPPRLAVNFFIF